MASLAELQDALVNADKAGDTDAARQLADAIHGMQSTQSAQPAAVSIGQDLNSIPRQLGLTARYGLEGLGNAAQIVAEPLRYITDKFVPDRHHNLSDVVKGDTAPIPKSTPLGVQATKLADWMGLPTPQGANERVIGDATRLLAGGAGTMFGAGAPIQIGKKVLSTGLGPNALTENPLQQLASAVGSGLAGGSSREAGGTTTGQVVSSVLGGLGGAGLLAGGQSLLRGATALKNQFLTPMTTQQMDVKINEVLAKSGVDYSQVPERTRQSLRAEMESSLRAGDELDPAAVARLVDFKRTGLTPTRGMLTLDPVQITREQNLAKMAANSSDSALHGLPRLQNQNNAQAINVLNESGASNGSMMDAGSSSVNSILGKDAAKQAGVNAAYDQARSMPGSNIPLDRTSFLNNIYSNLAKSNKMAFLPESVGNMLDTISKGVIRVGGQDHHVPFDADALDTLMTTIATAQRGTNDGNAKAALSAVRKALDDTPITPVKNTYGGNQMVTEQGASYLKNADAEAGNFMGALRGAKQQAAQRFGWQESGRPIEAALSGAQPDNFIKRFVINGTLKDAKDLATNAPIEPIKNAIALHLKEKALNGAADEVGKFGQSAFNKEFKALNDSGKLGLFFTKDEIENLASLGRAASYMQHQPVGSAVNNSNSGALLLGRGMDALNSLPVIGPMVGPALKNIQVSYGNSQAQKVLPALLAQAPKKRLDQSIVGLLGAPGIAMGGLLAAPPTN